MSLKSWRVIGCYLRSAPLDLSEKCLRAEGEYSQFGQFFPVILPFDLAVPDDCDEVANIGRQDDDFPAVCIFVVEERELSMALVDGLTNQFEAHVCVGSPIAIGSADCGHLTFRVTLRSTRSGMVTYSTFSSMMQDGGGSPL